jgi:hypothetical protein
MIENYTHEQLQEEYERVTGIVREVSGVLALAGRIVRERLELDKDEMRGLLYMLDHCRIYIDWILIHEKSDDGTCQALEQEKA